MTKKSEHGSGDPHQNSRLKSPECSDFFVSRESAKKCDECARGSLASELLHIAVLDPLHQGGSGMAHDAPVLVFGAGLYAIVLIIVNGAMDTAIPASNQSSLLCSHLGLWYSHQVAFSQGTYDR